jgi:hypothetical protein
MSKTPRDVPLQNNSFFADNNTKIAADGVQMDHQSLRDEWYV